MEQLSEEWFAYKLGKVSTSHLHEVLAKGKGDAKSLTREKYMVRLLKERLTGEREETFQSASMERGTILEATARDRYEWENFVKVEEIGYIDHPTIKNFLCSPDGLVNKDGHVEFKCRDSHNHIAYLEGKNVQGEARKQTQGQMACSGRVWNDYIHFDDRWPDKLQYFVIRIERDEKVICEIEKGVELFLEELEERYEKLLKRM